MADELYRQEIVIDVNDEDAIKRIERAETRINKVFKDMEKRANALGKSRFTPLLDLRDRMTPKLRTITHGLRSLTNRAWSVTITVKDKATEVVRGIWRKISSPIGLLGGATAGAAGVVYPLKLAGDMETARLSMDFFTESAEKGKKAMDDLLAFAAKTPFEFPFLRESATGLMGMYKSMTGDVDKSINETSRALRAFGDAAGYTGAGEQGMIGALLGYRQIGTIGKLTMEELRQVTENLLVPMKLVREELGLTEKQMQDIGNANIPAEKAMDAILRALEKNFGGGMGKLSKTFFGLWSTIKDTFRLGVMNYGEGMLDPVKRIFEDITGMTDYTSDDFAKFSERLKGYGKSVGDFFENTYFQVKNVIKSYMNNPGFQKLDFAGKVSFVVGDFAKGFDEWVTKKAAPKIGEYGAMIGTEMIKAMGLSAKEAIENNTLLSLLLAGYIGSKVPGPLPVKIAVTLGIIGIESGLVAETNEIGPISVKDIETIGESLKNITIPSIRLPDIKEHALGGIFKRPHFGLVAEDGLESIIPLNPSRRNRAIDLWEKTGEMLGLQKHSYGEIENYNNYSAPQVQAGSSNVILNFDMSGLVGQILIQAKDDLDAKADEIGIIIVNKLKSILNNLSD